MHPLILMLIVFAFAVIIGYFLISRVPPLLHTPLMSMTNAISAVTILGALLIFSEKTSSYISILGISALITASFNMAGGFVITNRMLKLFKKEQSDE